MKRKGTWLVGLLLFAGVCAVAAHVTEVEHWVELARHAQPYWLAVGFLLQMGTYLCVAAIWRSTLYASGARVPFATLLALAIAKLYSDQALPSGGVSGSAFVVGALARRGVDSRSAFSVLINSTLGYYAAYLAAAALALILLRVEHELQRWMLALALAFAMVAIAIPAAMLWVRSEAALTRLARLLPARLAEQFAKFAEVPDAMVRNWRLLVRSTLLNFLIFALDAGTLWAALVAVGDRGHAAAVLPSFVLASMATTIGPVPLGLGTFEAVCTGTLVASGTPIHAALAATLILRGFSMWLPMLPGLWLAHRALRAPSRGREDS